MTMNSCDCCHVLYTGEMKVVSLGGEPMHICQQCYLTCEDLMRLKKVPFGNALLSLKEALGGNEVESALILYDGQAQDETLDIIKVNRSPLTHEDYQALEYDFLDIYIPNPFFRNRQDQINWLNQLLEVALIGGDTKWAKNLYKQLTAVKERANNDTV